MGDQKKAKPKKFEDQYIPLYVKRSRKYFKRWTP